MDKYRILYTYLKKHIRWAIIGGIMMIFGVLLLIPTPLLTMHLIDVVLPSSNVKMLIYISILSIIILIVKAICDNVQQFFFIRFNHMTVFDIQMNILKSFQKSSTHYRHHKQSGYLMSRIMDDPNQIQSLFADTLISLMKDMITLIIGLIIIFYLHFKLAFITISLLPLFVIFLKKYNHKIKELSKKLLESNAQYKKKLQESLSMIDTFTIFNALTYDTIKLIQKKKEFIRTDIKRNLVGNIGGTIISLISGLGPIIVLVYGFYEIMMKRLTLGEFVAFNAFIGYIFGPTSRIVSTTMNMQKSIVAWDRIIEIINANPDSEKNEKKKHIKLKGHIKFESVNLSYGNQEILSNINLEINKGKTVALVGESGGGKSSLISLLIGINKCTSGNLFVDGVNINEIYNYNDNVSFVEQEPVLFSGTILENIIMGNRHISFDEVVNAALIANIHEYILSLPQKYNTQIDERGKNMSIGQKQRLAITRGIVRNPIIFIMDEPTANLDLETEKNIFGSISDYLRTRTSIIASHRLSSITFADEILVIKNGKIIEQGTHEILFNKKGYYCSLWNKQQI